MPTDKRQRKRGGHQARHLAMQQARRRQQQARRNRVIAATFVVVALIVGLSVAFTGGKESTDVATTGTTTTSTTAQVTASGARVAALPPVPVGESIKGETPCPNPDGSSPRTIVFEKPPKLCVNVAKTYTAEMTTTKGVLVIALDVKAATKTVNNFVVLARYHFYDGISFHRVVPGFVIQGGDPKQTGQGGPGYTFEDEPPKPGSYKVGSVASARSQVPNTNGSQFFIVSGDAGVAVPPNYSLFGQVTQGLDVVKAIDAVGTPESPTDPNGGRPTEVVTVKSITIKET
jgi:cyclophilin family peptidyl-prolyl cis-trans isomerase